MCNTNTRFMKQYDFFTFQVLKKSNSGPYIKHVVNSVFDYLLRQSDQGIENRADLRTTEYPEMK